MEGFRIQGKTYFGLNMDKGSSYVILFHYQPWIDLIDPIFIILNWFSIIRMQVLPLNLQGYPLFLSMGLHPELLWKKKRGYGSKYSRIYCYCIVHSSSYCLFTYYLCKNSQPKWLIGIPINHWRNEKGIKENKNPSLKWKDLVGILKCGRKNYI